MDYVHSIRESRRQDSIVKYTCHMCLSLLSGDGCIVARHGYFRPVFTRLFCFQLNLQGLPVMVRGDILFESIISATMSNILQPLYLDYYHKE